MSDDTSCGPGCAHALGPCTCARDGHARNCVHHTQEDFEAADRARGFAHPGLTHRNGDQCILLEDGTWFKPYDVGGEGVPCPNPEHETEIPQLVAWETTEYGVERSWPQWNDGKPVIEWTASHGMSHTYHYTRESVKSLSDGNRIFRRRRIKFQDILSEPELVDPKELP